MWVTLEPLTQAVPAAWAPVIEYAGGAVMIAGLIAGWVGRFRAARKKAMAAADKPSQPAPTLPSATNPFGADPSITAKIMEANVALARMGWDMDEMRRRCDERVSALREERDQLAQDATRTATTLAATEAQLQPKQRELTSALAKQATLEAALDQWKAIAELRQQEVDELKARLPTDRPPRR